MRLELEGKKRPGDEVIMEMFSERYGWTPNQIRDMSVIDIYQYLEIISMKNKIEHIKSMKSNPQ